MGAGAVAGHGATIAIEKVGAPSGTFTSVAELNGNIQKPAISRPNTDVTAHGDTIDYHVLGVPTRAPLSFSINYVFNNGTHDHLTGMQALFWANTVFGLRMRGPAGSSGVDEWIMSG